MSCKVKKSSDPQYCGTIKKPQFCDCNCAQMDCCTNPIHTNDCMDCPTPSIQLRTRQNCVHSKHSNNSTHLSIISPVNHEDPNVSLKAIHKAGGGDEQQTNINIANGLGPDLNLTPFAVLSGIFAILVIANIYK